jgi:hypothetical protein
MCAWTFAASNETPDPVSDSIIVDKEFWRCRTPLASNTPIEGLIIAFAESRPIFAPLPGSNQTIMEGQIDDCFIQLFRKGSLMREAFL